MVWRQKAKIFRLTLHAYSSSIASGSAAPKCSHGIVLLCVLWMSFSFCSRCGSDEDGKAGDQFEPEHSPSGGGTRSTHSPWLSPMERHPQSGWFSVLVFKAEGQDGVRMKKCELNQLQGHKWSGFGHDFKLGGPQKAKTSALCICSSTIWL